MEGRQRPGAWPGPGPRVAGGPGGGPGAPRSGDPRCLLRHSGGHPGHGSVKSLESQSAKLVSVPMKVQIHRQSKVPKVPMRACHPHGGAHARPISIFEEWSHYTKLIILFRNFTTPCPGKFTSKSWTETIRNLKVHKAVHCVHLKNWPSKHRNTRRGIVCAICWSPSVKTPTRLNTPP